MINVLFDQYQRYNNVKLIVDQMRTENQVFNILEVGANEHRNLEKFLPQDTIKYLDISLPDHLIADPNYILGDATAMDFGDDSFDIVVALDVFEHIPEERRKKFIDELYRVSKQFFVVTAPFASSEVSIAENSVNSFYKGIFKKDFIWLQEHIDNGLPSLQRTENYLNSKKMEYKIIHHGNLKIWKTMMKIHFSAAKNPELAAYREEMDIFYNSFLFPFDYTEESYRKIIIVSKAKDMSLISGLGRQRNIEEAKWEELYEREKDFYNMSVLLSENHKVEEQDKKILSEVKVYLDSGEGYNESETISELISGSTFTRHNFNLFNYPALKSLRVDPTEHKVALKIENIKIVDKNNEDVKYEISGNFSFHRNEVYFFKEDDPFIIFNFNKEVELLSFSFDINWISLDLNYLFTDIEKEINNQETIIQNILQDQELELKKCEMKFEKMKKDNMDLNESIEEFKEKTKKIKQQIESLNKEKNILNNELLDIYNSKAWRSITIVRRIIGK